MNNAQPLVVNFHPLVEQGFTLAECPRWDWRNTSWCWVDIAQGELWRLDSEQQLTVRRWDDMLGCFAMYQQAGYVLATKTGVYLLDSWDAERQLISPLHKTHPRMRFNDGRAAPGGRFIAGTRNGAKEGDQGQFFQLSQGGQLQPMPMYAWTCNGLAFSPCGNYLYWADTGSSVIYRADYDPATGQYGESQPFCDLTDYHGRPDGACVDSEGGYWVAMYSGQSVVRIDPNGNVSHIIPVPLENPTMVALGGIAGNQLVVTSAEGESEPGSVLTAVVDWQGMNEPLVTVL
ncbi:SMP-30/gluconolactonase/LRE family protein [Photobacterium nomapromontoriensis]|uniref:SMP-30/gluconolactonase/LRE family protein n=1 Tax=Photobacterium nomapromontoriensis TaxID=2910237 RepID=UPI003D0C3AB0